MQHSMFLLEFLFYKSTIYNAMLDRSPLLLEYCLALIESALVRFHGWLLPTCRLDIA